MRDVFEGRRVVFAGAVAAAWTEHTALLESLGVTEMMVYATEGRGVGPVPDLPTVVVEPPAGLALMDGIRFGNDALADPSPAVRRALDAFDPHGEALVVGSFLSATPELAGREFLAYRHPAWEALEDKVVVDAFWDRASVDRQPSAVVPLAGVGAASARLDRGTGTVWAADARDGFHGGGSQTYWVTDAASADHARNGLAAVCDMVRVMPFVEGVPCSIHGIVLPDGVVVLRPVEMVVLRSRRRGFGEFVYAGCATFWDPPDAIRGQMREVARRVGRRLDDEVGFRGTFTVDGVAAADGFWPTELNPRFGAGIMTIARASGLPMLMLHHVIAGGHPVGRAAADIERDLLEGADARRGGGTWKWGLPVDATFTGRRAACGSDDAWRWAHDTETGDADVTSGVGFVRCAYDAASTPVGPSTARRAAGFWAFADREVGSDLGALSASVSPWE